MTIYKIDLDNDGGATYNMTTDTSLLSIEMKYNYSSQCWVMDIYDEEKTLLIAGVMLVPNIDLLKGHRQLKEQIGTFALYEQKSEDYKDPDSLGKTTVLVWFSPEETGIL
jgi:hypothetical protein